MKNFGIICAVGAIAFTSYVMVSLIAGGHTGYAVIFGLMLLLAYAGLKAELNELKKNKED